MNLMTVSPSILKRTILLVGMMGCGKSTIGRALAKQLQVPFYDTDHEIEVQAGCSCSVLFEQQGEAEFRRLEYEALDSLLQREPGVIATGGGAFIQEPVRTLIAERHAVSLWLNTSFEILLERVSRKNTRPLLEQGDKAVILRELLDKRLPIYRHADIEISSNERPHMRVVKTIIRRLENDNIVNNTSL